MNRGEWKTIDSAPKDREVLLWFECRDVQDDPIIDKCYWDDDPVGRWIISCECATGLQRAQQFYTHWQPLPGPPDTTGAT